LVYIVTQKYQEAKKECEILKKLDKDMADKLNELIEKRK